MVDDMLATGSYKLIILQTILHISFLYQSRESTKQKYTVVSDFVIISDN